MRAVKVGAGTLPSPIADVDGIARSGGTISTSGGCTYRIDRLVIDGLPKCIRQSKEQPPLEPFAQSCLEGVVIGISARIDIRNGAELLVRAQMEVQRVLLDALNKQADVVLG